MPDKFPKMQRYNIFIAKMEQLAAMDALQQERESIALEAMRSSFVTSSKPLKDILYHYNKAAVRGFEGSLVAKTLH